MTRLAKELIDKFGSIGAVPHADPEQLRDFKGIGAVTGGGGGLGPRGGGPARPRQGPQPVSGLVLDGPPRLLPSQHGPQAEEALSHPVPRSPQALIADEVQQEGTVDRTPMYPREVYSAPLSSAPPPSFWCTITRAAIPRPRRPTSKLRGRSPKPPRSLAFGARSPGDWTRPPTRASAP